MNSILALVLAVMVAVQPPSAGARVLEYTQKKGLGWLQAPPILSPPNPLKGLNCIDRGRVLDNEVHMPDVDMR
ncbi:hypothetical protein Tco_0308257 [Tanacetum coccineum]